MPKFSPRVSDFGHLSINKKIPDKIFRLREFISLAFLETDEK